MADPRRRPRKVSLQPDTVPPPTVVWESACKAGHVNAPYAFPIVGRRIMAVTEGRVHIVRDEVHAAEPSPLLSRSCMQAIETCLDPDNHTAPDHTHAINPCGEEVHVYVKR